MRRPPNSPRLQAAALIARNRRRPSDAQEERPPPSTTTLGTGRKQGAYLRLPVEAVDRAVQLKQRQALPELNTVR